ELGPRGRIGFGFQEATLGRDLAVQQNVRFAARLWDLPGRLAGPRVDGLLGPFGLREPRRAAVRTLSGSRRRAPGLGVCVVRGPVCLARTGHARGESSAA